MNACAALFAGVAALTIPVQVEVGTTVPRGLAPWVLRETNAIWENIGIKFDAPLNADVNSKLRIVIDGDSADADDAATERRIGWIGFSGPIATPTIHLSYRGVSTLLQQAQMVGIVVDTRTTMMRNVVVGRGLGRALAHELVHFFLSSKNHTTEGLMRRIWSAHDVFSFRRWNMDIQVTAEEKAAMLTTAQAWSHTPGAGGLSEPERERR